MSNVSTNFENHYNQIFDYLSFKICSSEAIDNDEDSSVINKYDNYEVTELKDILSDNKKRDYLQVQFFVWMIMSV